MDEELAAATDGSVNTLTVALAVAEQLPCVPVTLYVIDPVGLMVMDEPLCPPGNQV